MKLSYPGVMLALLLAGCAHNGVQPTPIVSRATTVEPIRVPVLVPCLTAEQVPRPPSTWMRPGKSGEYNELAAAIDLQELNDYLVRSQSLMLGCVRALETMEKP